MDESGCVPVGNPVECAMPASSTDGGAPSVARPHPRVSVDAHVGAARRVTGHAPQENAMTSEFPTPVDDENRAFAPNGACAPSADVDDGASPSKESLPPVTVPPVVASDGALPIAVEYGAPPPPSRLAEKMVRARIPAWNGRDLAITETEWDLRLDSFHPLALLSLRAQGLWRERPFHERLAKAMALFEENGAFAGWTVELRGSFVVADGLTVKRPDEEDDRPSVWSDRRDLTVEQRTPPLQEGVLHLTPPDGVDFALVCVERAFTGDPRVASQFFDVHPRGNEAGSLAFHREFARVTNLLRAHLRERLPNESVDIVNTSMMLSLDDSLAWDDLILSPSVVKAVREDFSFFLAHEDWYRRNRLPYKRSYLLAGPPGNGKTSIVRVMARTAGFRAITFDFAAEDNRNEDLQRAFGLAVERAPCLFILEDVDRLFADNAPTHVTKEAILNCLDGVAANNGVVIAATANQPEHLDGALRHRPGRFDRVVFLENPDVSLREAYLRHLFGRSPDAEVSEGALSRVAEGTEGFSMAHIKELFIGAGRECLGEGGFTIGDEHVERALLAVREQFTGTLGRRAGFGH